MEELRRNSFSDPPPNEAEEYGRWMKRHQKQLQARLKVRLRECAIEGSWTLKVFRQNAAMASLEREQARNHVEAAARQLQHAPGSKAAKEYMLEQPPVRVAPVSLRQVRCESGSQGLGDLGGRGDGH